MKIVEKSNGLTYRGRISGKHRTNAQRKQERRTINYTTTTMMPLRRERRRNEGLE